jgi:hypothetical protein
MYTMTNYKTKKALRAAIKAGDKVTVYQPSDIGFPKTINGAVSLEGPHYPKPHTWYATGTLQDGVLIRVK